MKIGIIGSAAVGQTLAKAFLAEGHEVTMGTRDTSKPEIVKWAAENPAVAIAGLDETAKFGDIIVLATAGEGAEEAVKLAGIENFSGKTVIDTTNPIKKAAPVNGVLPFFTDINLSLMEKLQALIPGAFLVKAFNSVGNLLMYKPALQGGKPTMFICGNNAEAKQTVTEILEAFGWEIADMGAMEAARAIEPLCMLWCIPGLSKNEWMHAFKLLKA